MNDRVREFVEGVAQTIIGLDIALFYQANPTAFDTPTGIALRTHRSVAEVQPVLERLAGHGILETHSRGDGRYMCYALAKTHEVWDLLCLLSEAYLDNPEDRKEIVRILVRGQQGRRDQRAADQASRQG